jgi:hypothetical protein
MKSTKKDDAAISDDAREAQSGGFAPLRLQVALEPRADARYHVDQLLSFHDRAFVESAYAATLGRAPTNDELSVTLGDLRTSRREKREIVEDLIGSEEGALVGARERVEGIAQSGWKRRVRSLPVIGYLWQLLASVARLPVALRHQREFEAYALAQQQLILEHVNYTQERALDKARDEIRRLVGLIGDAQAAVSLLSDALAGLAARQAEAHADLARRIDATRSEVESRIDAARESIIDTQQEFLTREQHAIVEAQKAALAEIEGRLAETLASQRDALAKLSSLVAKMPARVKDESRASLEGAGKREGGDVETQ